MGVDEQETVEVVGARMIATAQLLGREADAGSSTAVCLARSDLRCVAENPRELP
jgi:hypothetical protein